MKLHFGIQQMITSLILCYQSSFKYLTIQGFSKCLLNFHFKDTEVLNVLGMVKLQMLVESIGVLLCLHVLLVRLHPGVPGVSCLAMVLGHQVALATEGAAASVHCAAPGVRASLEARGTQHT